MTTANSWLSFGAGDMLNVLLMTFEIPRKSYLHSLEWLNVSGAWRMGLLSAGATGVDEHGSYQIFSLTDSGKGRLA